MDGSVKPLCELTRRLDPTNKLPNFKALGLQKAIESEFNLIEEPDLQLLIESEYFSVPVSVGRNDNRRYCHIMVVDSHEMCWYKNLIGFTFFCEMMFRQYIKPCGQKVEILRDFWGCKLTNNRVIRFRMLNPEHVIIL